MCCIGSSSINFKVEELRACRGAAKIVSCCTAISNNRIVCAYGTVESAQACASIIQ